MKEYFTAILTGTIPLKDFFFMQNTDNTMITKQSNFMRIQRPKCKSIENGILHPDQKGRKLYLNNHKTLVKKRKLQLKQKC